jgi:monoamine oxidase
MGGKGSAAGMADSDNVVIIGGGAAGIAAGRRLRAASVDCLILEARPRLGGRAWTSDASGFALDLGCGWLHSADRNPWNEIAAVQGRTLDRTTPPWMRPAIPIGFSPAEQREFRAAQQAFFERLEAGADNGPDRPAAAFLEPGCRWNPLITAVGTYIAGAELDHVSAQDLNNYEDSGINWRVVEGYGTTIAAAATGVPVALDCLVTRVEHGGKRLRVETSKGTLTADQVIVTLPTAVLAEGRIAFTPDLPDKIEAAAGLPLGLADKLFLALTDAEEFEADTRLFGRTDRSGTATYHMRPFGRPLIETYFGGQLAWELEAAGEGAFFDFAVSELTGLLGSAFARRLAPLRMHRWGADPFAGGSYSYARPGRAKERQTLAAPVGGRLFFAGEACSINDFSTAHGAWLTGMAAAEQAIAARSRT